MSDDLTDDEMTDLATLSKQRLPRRGLQVGESLDHDHDTAALEGQLLQYVRDRDWDSVIAAAAALRKRGGR